MVSRRTRRGRSGLGAIGSSAPSTKDKPYDQFIIEQIAGDLLPEATQGQRVATGFLRNSMINQEGGIDPEQFRMEAMFNRMDLIGRGVLGLTVACAQCHSHKYDPLTQTEYYQMMAFLNNTTEGSAVVYTRKEQEQRSALLAFIGELEDEVKAEHTTWPDMMATWEAEVRQDPAPEWEVLALEYDDSSSSGQKFLPQPDGSYLAQGYSPGRTSPKMETRTGLKTITAIRLELLADPNLPAGGPGRSKVGACGLSEVDLRVTTDDLENQGPREVEGSENRFGSERLQSAGAAHRPGVSAERKRSGNAPLPGAASHLAIDGDENTAWTTDIDPGRRNQSRYAIFTLAEPLEVEEGMRIAFQLHQRHGGWNNNDGQTNNMGRFRISVTDAEQLPDRAVPEKGEAHSRQGARCAVCP